ncbi:hypothetical protein YTPLAS18_39740 [Nitrospira sp.]|nr:hypothetical protein YTPLAS18_39740 [Nitrospira sp.]
MRLFSSTRFRGALVGAAVVSCAAVLCTEVLPGYAQPVSEAKSTGQLTPPAPASIPLKPIGDIQQERPSLPPSDPLPGLAPATGELAPADPVESATYDPSGRRDPFVAIIQLLQQKKEDDANLPPLQRIGLTEINLVGVVWGGAGYTAMVQTPDGKGYAIRRGTRMGPNNGIVTSITERGLIVVERFTDIYGKKQEREFVRLLHQKEGSE